jgi:hypothetical protein
MKSSNHHYSMYREVYHVALSTFLMQCTIKLIPEALYSGGAT